MYMYIISHYVYMYHLVYNIYTHMVSYGRDNPVIIPFHSIFHAANVGYRVHLRCQRRSKDLAGTCNRIRWSRYGMAQSVSTVGKRFRNGDGSRKHGKILKILWFFGLNQTLQRLIHHIGIQSSNLLLTGTIQWKQMTPNTGGFDQKSVVILK